MANKKLSRKQKFDHQDLVHEDHEPESGPVLLTAEEMIVVDPGDDSFVNGEYVSTDPTGVV